MVQLEADTARQMEAEREAAAAASAAAEARVTVLQERLKAAEASAPQRDAGPPAMAGPGI